MIASRPRKLHEYTRHPIIEGTRWNDYRHRPGDIVISTSYKSGTTWTQTIVANLLYQDGNLPAPVTTLSPWLDMTMAPAGEAVAQLEAQTDRRFIKTHLPLDGLPYFETARYIVVGRDLRDVFMSIWNHHSKHTAKVQQGHFERARALGREFPEFDDLHAMFRVWISQGGFAWESSGHPYWSHLHHTQTWWDFRHLPNILLVHFADLLEDTEREIRRIAAHIDVEIDEGLLPGILGRVSFGSMKKNFAQIVPDAAEIWKGGGRTFMNKGTNGRWRSVLTEEELEQCRTAVERELAPDAAEWLEYGGEGRL